MDQQDLAKLEEQPVPKYLPDGRIRGQSWIKKGTASCCLLSQVTLSQVTLDEIEEQSGETQCRRGDTLMNANARRGQDSRFPVSFEFANWSKVL